MGIQSPTQRKQSRTGRIVGGRWRGQSRRGRFKKFSRLFAVNKRKKDRNSGWEPSKSYLWHFWVCTVYLHGFWTTLLMNTRLANFNAAVITYTWINKIYTQLSRLLHTAKMAAMFTLLGGGGGGVGPNNTIILKRKKLKKNLGPKKKK